MLPAVSVVQISLAALAYVTLLFFTESAQSAETLRHTSDHILARLIPESLARITDHRGRSFHVEVEPPSGVVGRAYRLATDAVEMRFWIGLNVSRAILCIFIAPKLGVEENAFKVEVQRVFATTLNGAKSVGYSDPSLEFENIPADDGNERVLTLWLSWDLLQQTGEGGAHREDFLTDAPMQLFFAQDVALMVQSFVRASERHGIHLTTRLSPTPF